MVHVTLCSSNPESAFATLDLVLPGSVSTNWGEGRWRGQLLPSYVRPDTQVKLASDYVDAPGWRTLKCRLDTANPRDTQIILDGQIDDDVIELFIPADGGSTTVPVWNHVTDAGGAESGKVRMSQQ